MAIAKDISFNAHVPDYVIVRPGRDEEGLTWSDLRRRSAHGDIRPGTLLRTRFTDRPTPAHQWPGLMSWRSRRVALVLSILLGWAGADRLYLGFWRSALGKLFTFGGFGLWWFVDVVRIFRSSLRDIEGRYVVD